MSLPHFHLSQHFNLSGDMLWSCDKCHKPASVRHIYNKFTEYRIVLCDKCYNTYQRKEKLEKINKYEANRD